MLDILANIAQVLGTTATPGQLLVIVAIGYVIYLLNKNKKETEPEIDDEGRPITLKLLTENHLHELPQMNETLTRIETSLKEISKKQDDANNTLAYLKGRMNGKSD